MTPATRQPYLRRICGDKADNEMNLPDGKTCADCRHCQHCCDIYGRIPEDQVCDWHPSRFTPISAAVQPGDTP
mgnify:CR=1 FL=1